MCGRRKTDNDSADGRFSNSFVIGMSGYVFIFEFGMISCAGSKHFISRIVMNPADAAEFSEMLAEAVGQHADKYGPIKKKCEPAASALPEPSMQ